MTSSLRVEFSGPRHEITGVQKLAMDAQSQMFKVDVFDSE